MPIKDIIHTYECKYCKQKWTMFDAPDGTLLYFPQNTIRPVHGEWELVYHLKHKHWHNYNMDTIFYGNDNKTLINLNFHILEAQNGNEETRV